MAAEDRNTERVAVQTTVPADQRDVWGREADRLGMSRAEFVRSMVQAGRRSFDLPEPEYDGEDGQSPETPSDPFDPGGQAVEERVLAVLADGERQTWHELVGELTVPLEDRLESILKRLDDDDVVGHDPRNGGYGLVEDGN